MEKYPNKILYSVPHENKNIRVTFEDKQCTGKTKIGVEYWKISVIRFTLLNPCPNPPARALTNVAASCDVSAVHSRLEVVIFVVDLKSTDAANKTGVKTKEAANILHSTHAANIERLVECYPREQALVIKDLISRIK